MVESNANQSNKISRRELAKILRSAKDFHMICRRNDYIMPALSSRACSLKFMMKIKQGYFFCPKKSHIANIPECFSWPDKEFLLKKLQQFFIQAVPSDAPMSSQEELDRYKRTIAYCKKKQPDTAWLLTWMGIFMRTDEIFARSWQWRRPKKQEESDDELVSNDDGFYSNHPQHDDKTIKNTNRLIRPKQEVLEKKLKKAKVRRTQAKEREEELAYELEVLSSDSDIGLVLSEIDDAIEENQILEQSQLREVVNKEAVENGSDSDFQASPKQKKKKSKFSKQTKRKLELVEEAKEEPDFRSSIRTRSALKAKRTDADSVTSQLAGAKIGGGDVIMDDF